MGTSHRRRRGAYAAAVALTAVGFLAPPPASAELIILDDPAPLEQFASCPDASQFPADLPPLLCLRVKAYDGHIKIGSVVADVGPIDISVGVGFRLSPDGVETAIVSGGGGGGPAPVRIPGGVLGIPELDSLLDKTLGLLSVSATPEIGTIGINGDESNFVFFLTGLNEGPASIRLPLSINVNNMLLGDQCEIPPFDINLTTGTTTPPAGVEPLTGGPGEYRQEGYLPSETLIDFRTGMTFVDNAFAVPEATNCGLLVGPLLDGAGLDELNVFDTVVDGQAGIPSPAGANYATFKVDTALIGYSLLSRAQRSPESISFGNATVGTTTAVETITVTSTGNRPLRPIRTDLLPGLGGPGQFQVVDDRCTGQVIPSGETCGVDVAFSPTAVGNRTATVNISTNANDSLTVELHGRGVA